MKRTPFKTSNKPCIKCGGPIWVRGMGNGGIRICDNEKCGFQERD